MSQSFNVDSIDITQEQIKFSGELVTQNTFERDSESSSADIALERELVKAETKKVVDAIREAESAARLYCKLYEGYTQIIVPAGPEASEAVNAAMEAILHPKSYDGDVSVGIGNIGQISGYPNARMYIIRYDDHEGSVESYIPDLQGNITPLDAATQARRNMAMDRNEMNILFTVDD